MKKNPIETILGFFVLIFTVVFLVFSASRVDTKTINGYTVTANFSKIGGLTVGSDVRIAGIKVGAVIATKLDPDTYTANVYLNIDANVKLPIDTEASIADVGIMGDKYIRLEPGTSRALLKDKDMIAKTHSYKSLEDNISEFIFLATK
jgi:phospholipid/cholesterol/gamma-HCH transport system substrate-binding protein